MNKSASINDTGDAVLPLVEVLVSYVSAVQHQCIHYVNCVDSTLSFALRTKYNVFTHVKPLQPHSNHKLHEKACQNTSAHHLVRQTLIISALREMEPSLKRLG